VMPELIIQPTTTAQWHSLVHDAENCCAQHLNEELESYLVFLLMRFTECPELINSIISVELLETSHQFGKMRQDRLQEVGDKCLLFSGLFPEIANRRRVTIRYYVDLGQTAYGALSSLDSKKLAQLFSQLQTGFTYMMDVLQTMRVLHKDVPLLQPLTAYELWQDTGSQAAWQDLKKQCNKSIPIINNNNGPNKTH